MHRQTCDKFLPKKILARKKRGFAVNVVDQWFRDDTSNSFKRWLSDKDLSIREFIRLDKVRDLVEKHQAGEGDYHKILFSLIMFETSMNTTLHK